VSTVATIHVLAGVNGAGKSIAGEAIFKVANAHGWQIGKALLENAITGGRDFRFETTLGGNTIPALLERAARARHRVHVWFCGLESVELHIQRVQARASRGGHDIPVEKIHQRWRRSRENLVRLLPHIHHLRMYDNSYEADPVAGERPRPCLLLEMREGKITAPADLSGAPDWAQPIIAAAIHLHTGSRPAC
jgi:predicted ABC-type ATPase